MQDTLTKTDFKKWFHDFIIFCVLPVVLVFLTTLQTANFTLALGAAYGTLIASAINLIRKEAAGIPGVPSEPVNSEPEVPAAPVATV